MKRANIIIILVTIIIFSSLVGYAIFAAASASMTISNRITFNSEGILYKATGNVFIMTTEEFNSYGGNIENLIAGETKVVGPLSADNLDDGDEPDNYWIISEGLRFTSSDRYIVYTIEIENRSNYDITIRLNPPAIPENLTDTIENTASEPITLGKSVDQTYSKGTIYLITQCKKIKNPFEFDNSFIVNIDQVIW